MAAFPESLQGLHSMDARKYLFNDCSVGDPGPEGALCPLTPGTTELFPSTWIAVDSAVPVVRTGVAKALPLALAVT